MFHVEQSSSCFVREELVEKGEGNVPRGTIVLGKACEKSELCEKNLGKRKKEQEKIRFAFEMWARRAIIV